MAELRPSGFPEYSPAQQLIFDQITEIITRNYKQFGYTHIHTPAVEKNTTLLAKNGEETWKQIFGLYGMSQGASDLKDYGLHFDLTVPFARYTLDREHALTFPFKRYQIQPVWRGERAQKGRFREFFQCDIDVIWKGEKDYLYYDAEIIATLGQTLTNIIQSTNLNDNITFHINNKKIVKSFLAEISESPEQAQAISNLIDKFDKIGAEKFESSLIEDLNISGEIKDKILTFISFCTPELEKLNELKKLSSDETFQQGITELETVLSLLDQIKSALNLSFNTTIDMKIIRGLDYYTGTIFEATFDQMPSLGSICGGWRYANLTWYIDAKRQDYCGVWGSIGISRILSRIFDETDLKQQTIADYLILNFENSFETWLSLIAHLKSQGRTFEYYPHPDKLGKQFAYADKKGIPFVIICGEGEKDQGIYKIKDMKTGEESIHKL